MLRGKILSTQNRDNIKKNSGNKVDTGINASPPKSITLDPT
jgi:hypothetical protein